MTLTHIFATGSSEQAAYIAKFPIGAKISGNDQVWTVVDVDVDDTIPPEPLKGTPSTKVTITLTNF